MSEQVDLEELWEQVQERLHAGEINRSLWDAAAIAKPLVLEEELLVLGLAPVNMRHGSYLISTTNKPKVQQAVEEVLGRRVDIAAIEGTTPEAWEGEKQRRAHRAEAAEAELRARVAGASVEEIWSDLHQRIGKIFAHMSARRFPLGRARMLTTTLEEIRDAEERARKEAPEAAAAHDKEVNRAIDRVAVLAEMPATVVAVEYLRVRDRKG